MIRYIYTFFLGLFLAIFVGMGIAVFYEAPKAPEEPTVFQSVGKEGPTAAQQQEINAFEAKQKEYNKEMWRYNRNVSIIVLVCAVLILAISLLFSEKLGVLADGLLLGGIFTLLYGIGRGMASESNKYRFLVASVGLIVTLVLGYTKFTRHELKASREAGGVVAKLLLLVVVLAVLAGGVFGTYNWQHNKLTNANQQVTQLSSDLAKARDQAQSKVVANTYTSAKGVSIKVYLPDANSKLTSPVVVMGEVPGNWSFEASFPVKIYDSKGTLVTQTPAQLQGNWMTDQLVPFTAKLTFSSVVSGNGTLVLQKDNPSGIASNDDTLTIPITL